MSIELPADKPIDQLKSIVNTVKDMTKMAEELFGINEKEKTVQENILTESTQKEIKELERDTEKMINDKEKEKMIVVLSEYCKLLLNPDEIKSLDSMFLGNSLEDHIREYLQEQEFIHKELKKNNLVPQQALQKAFDMYDPTTNIQSLLDEISAHYFAQPGKEKYTSTTQYFQSLLLQKEFLSTRQQQYKSHTPETRLKTKPNPDLVRYHDEEKVLKKTGFAYDVNAEKDPQMKTPQNILKRFVSSGVAKSETGVTLCSRTTKLDSDRLFHLPLPSGNAFDVMRQEKGNFSTSIVSDLYNKKEKAKTKVDSIHPNWNMGKNDYINKIAPQDSNVADLYVTSSTKNGRKYGHRALMFRVSNQWYVLDPYTAIQPGEDKNKPRTLESYTKSMQTGGNKREFMRMNFYNAPVNLEAKAMS